jgi:predicted nucleic acid-binding protein
VTVLLLDTSVLIKWFHSEGESEAAEARAVRGAHVAGTVDAHMLDLGTYELGNVLLRALHWSASDVADQLDDVQTLLGPPLVMSAAAQRSAAAFAEQHSLSFYDACWAAAAADLAVPLVSADRQLLTAGLAESATQITERLRLSIA